MNQWKYYFHLSWTISSTNQMHPEDLSAAAHEIRIIFFARTLICFRGDPCSVTMRFPGDNCIGDVQSVFIPSSIQIIADRFFGSGSHESLELVIFEPYSQLIYQGANPFWHLFEPELN
jgi:hypothetical protein